MGKTVTSAHLTVAKDLAKRTGGKFISTERQLKNGTFMFTFPQKPGKRYAYYASGTVRCVSGPQRHYFGFMTTSMTPLFFEKINGHRVIRKISFIDAISYFLKRFENN